MRSSISLYGRTLTLAALLVSGGCSDSSRTARTSLESADPTLPRAPALEAAQLELQLKAGDRFPLRKTVDQEVVQSVASSVPALETTRSRLELLMALTVDDIDSDGTRCTLRYDRVRYSRDDGVRRTDFDSAHPPLAIPLGLAAYQGMVGHGFCFWIGPEHRIVRVSGFAEFVKRALREVPAENRDEALLGVESVAGEDSVTDFLDDTIGLLPRGAPRSAGDAWRCTRRLARPVPMHIDTLCTLRELTDEFAVIDVRGEVTPLVSTGVQTVAHRSTQMVVERGTTVGECIVFRDSGLPKESRLVQEVDLVFNVAGEPPVKQHQRVTTTIECYPARTVNR